MKNMVVYLRLNRYLREWLTFHLGCPVRFPNRSYENALLHRLLSKRPEGAPPSLPVEGAVPVVITDCSYKKPEHYNYLGRRGEQAMAVAIEALFRLDLWSGCAPLIHSGAEINRGIDAWCAASGISLDAREAVRQKFYRIRRDYLKHGVVLGKNFRRKKGTIKVFVFEHNGLKTRK